MNGGLEKERWTSEEAEVTGFGDLIAGQGDEGVRGIPQLFAWVTGKNMPFTEQG